MSFYGLHRFQVRRNAESLLDRGRAAAAAGEYANAAKLYKNYLIFRPNDPAGVRGFAEALEAANPDRPPAEELAAAYLRLESLASLEPGERRRLARLYLLLGNAVRARENAELLLRDDPNDAGLVELVAAASELEGDFPAAVEALRRAVGGGEATPPAYVRLAELLRARVKTPEALAEAMGVLERLVADGPADPRRRVERAKARARAGDAAGAYADAAFAYSNLPAGPADAEVALTLAALSAAPAQWPTAREALGKSIAADPASTPLKLALADIEARAGDVAAARATLRRAAEGYAKLDATLMAIGDRMADLGDPEGAAGLAARFAAGPETAAPGDYLAGRAALARGDWPRALAALERCVADNGFARFPALRAKALVTLAEACASAGRPERRLAALAEARRLDGTNVAAAVAQAESLAREQPERAAELLAAAAPADAAARAALVELRLAQQLARPESARDWAAVARAAGDSPRPARVEVAYASALLAQGKSADAAKLLEDAAARPESARQAGVRVALAMCQSATDPAKARQTLAMLERDLGDSADLRLARLALLTREAKPDAKAAAGLAENLDRLAPAERARVARAASRVALSLGDRPGALALMRRAAAALPFDWSARLTSLDLAAAIGDAAARDELLGELRKFDEPVPAVAEATVLLRDLKPGDGRVADLTRRLSARPGFGPAEVALAELARLTGQGDAALGHYRKAAEAGEQSDGLVRNFVALLVERGATQEAIEVLARVGRSTGLSPELARQLVLLRATSEGGGAAVVAWAESAAGSTDWRDHLGRSAAYESAGQKAKARSAAKRAVALAGDRPEPWLNLVQLLAADGPRRDVLEAVAAAEKRLPVAGEPAVAATHAIARGAINRIAGRPAEAEAGYRAAVQALPGDANAAAQFAGFLREAGRPAEAASEFKRLADSPRPEVARWARRNLALDMTAGQPTPARRDEALALLDKNLADGNLVDDRRAKALVVATDPTRLAEGVAALRATAAESPLTAEQNYYLGLMESQAGNLEAAELALAEATRGGPAASEHLAALARVQLRRGDARAAAETAARLERLSPAGWPAASTAARVLAATGKRDEATARLADGPFAKDATLVAPVFEELGLAEAAEAALRGAVTDAPAGHARLAAHLVRARRGADAVELALGRPNAPEGLTAKILAGAVHSRPGLEAVARAEKWLAPRLAARPADPSLVLLEAVRLDHAGRHAEALAAYERGLGASPDDESLLNNAALLAALVGRDGGPKPMGWLGKLFAARGATGATLDTRAVVHLAGGRPAEAVRDLTAAIGINPSPLYWFHLAQAHDGMAPDPSAVPARNAAIDEAFRLGLTRESLHPTEWPAYDRYRAVRGK